MAVRKNKSANIYLNSVHIKFNGLMLVSSLKGRLKTDYAYFWIALTFW